MAARFAIAAVIALVHFYISHMMLMVATGNLETINSSQQEQLSNN
jgi:hypothetical protein